LFRRRDRNAERGCCLLKAQAHEVSQLHQFGFARFNAGELLQRFFYREQLIVVGKGGRDLHFIERNGYGARAAFGRHPPPRSFNQDAAHRLGSSTKEVRTVFELRCVVTREA
jgi:hypothetical protein